MTDEKIAWVDRQVLSQLWTNLIQKATYSYGESDYYSYRRLIRILTSSLFKIERDKVIAYVEQFEKMDTNCYMSVQQYIIDLLEEKGYLKYKVLAQDNLNENMIESKWELDDEREKDNH